MRRPFLLLLLLGGLGCHPQDIKPDPGPAPDPGPGPTPDPTPDPAPDPVLSDCEVMCRHIGPDHLDCEEGAAVYDSDLPGPPGVPNQSCAAFCERQQSNGVLINPRCVARVQSCDEIETARQHCEL